MATPRRQVRFRGRTQIQRYSFPMVRRRVVIIPASEDNPFSNSAQGYSFDRTLATACTLQPLKAAQFAILPEGLRQEDVFSLFTNTPMFQSINNTDRLSDSVYVPTAWFAYNGQPAAENQGGWYTVVTPPKHYASGIANHCEAMLVKDWDMIDTEGGVKYPSTVDLDPLINSREKLMGDLWHSSWIGGNE